MDLKYNVIGARRKELVKAVAEIIGSEPVYKAAPTFCYEVGGYHIDKNGVVTGPDNLDLESGLHALHGFEAAEREYDNPDNYESGLGGMVAKPTIEELNELWAESEMRRMKLEDANVPDYSNRGQYGGDDISGVDEPQDYNTIRSVEITPRADRLTIEMPLSGFTPEKLDNLAKLVNAKSPLLKAALGTDDLPIKQTADTLQFPWFRGTIDAEHTEAYAALISLLCKTAIEKKRVTAKGKDGIDNPKYAMRCFLLSLGFIGDGYKAARKILLKNFSGSSAYAKPSKTEVAADE